jgi:hypothetical protein
MHSVQMFEPTTCPMQRQARRDQNPLTRYLQNKIKLSQENQHEELKAM